MATIYGYARVSTVGQTLEVQLDGLKAAGCTRIFREKVSGARAGRRGLNKMLSSLEDGDLVVVTRIDRLARSTFDLFAIVKSHPACQFGHSPLSHSAFQYRRRIDHGKRSPRSASQISP